MVVRIGCPSPDTYRLVTQALARKSALQQRSPVAIPERHRARPETDNYKSLAEREVDILRRVNKEAAGAATFFFEHYFDRDGHRTFVGFLSIVFIDSLSTVSMVSRCVSAPGRCLDPLGLGL